MRWIHTFIKLRIPSPYSEMPNNDLTAPGFYLTSGNAHKITGIFILNFPTRQKTLENRVCKSSKWTATLLDVKALGNVPFGCSFCGFCDCWAPRPLWVLATNVIKQRDANPSKEVKGLARRCESEGRGFKSWCRQRIFSHEYLLMFTCTIILSWNLYNIKVWVAQCNSCLMCICAEEPWIW